MGFHEMCRRPVFHTLARVLVKISKGPDRAGNNRSPKNVRAGDRWVIGTVLILGVSAVVATLARWKCARFCGAYDGQFQAGIPQNARSATKGATQGKALVAGSRCGSAPRLDGL